MILLENQRQQREPEGTGEHKSHRAPAELQQRIISELQKLHQHSLTYCYSKDDWCVWVYIWILNVVLVDTISSVLHHSLKHHFHPMSSERKKKNIFWLKHACILQGLSENILGHSYTIITELSFGGVVGGEHTFLNSFFVLLLLHLWHSHKNLWF